jgi:hypothetical protein
LPLPIVRPPAEVTDDLGCFVFMAIFAAFGVVVAFATDVIWLIVPVVAIAIALAGYIVKQKVGIHAGVQHLQDEEQLGLVVYSDSQLWKSRIEEEWLPRFGARVAVLNWSERRQWDPTDPLVRLFYGAVDLNEDFNPAVILLRTDRRPLLFRFYPAFKHAQFGHPEELQRMERQMFGVIDGVIRTVG